MNARHVRVEGQDHWRWVNGHAPRGTGSWHVQVGDSVVVVHGSWTEAQRVARRVAVERGVHSVRVLS